MNITNTNSKDKGFYKDLEELNRNFFTELGLELRDNRSRIDTLIDFHYSRDRSGSARNNCRYSDVINSIPSVGIKSYNVASLRDK